MAPRLHRCVSVYLHRATITRHTDLSPPLAYTGPGSTPKYSEKPGTTNPYSLSLFLSSSLASSQSPPAPCFTTPYSLYPRTTSHFHISIIQAQPLFNFSTSYECITVLTLLEKEKVNKRHNGVWKYLAFDILEL